MQPITLDALEKMEKYGQNFCKHAISKEIEALGGEIDLFINNDSYGGSYLEISVVYVLGGETQQKHASINIPGIINDARTRAKTKILKSLELFVIAKISELLRSVKVELYAYKLAKEKEQQEDVCQA